MPNPQAEEELKKKQREFEQKQKELERQQQELSQKKAEEDQRNKNLKLKEQFDSLPGSEKEKLLLERRRLTVLCLITIARMVLNLLWFAAPSPTF